MKLFRRTFLLLSLTATMFFVQCSCGDDTETTPETQITRLSRVWVVENYFINGTEDTSTDVSGFSLTLDSSDPNTATSYSVTTGGLQNPAPSTSGNWSVSGATITFDGTTNVSALALPSESNPDEFNIEWTARDADDKNDVTYRMNLMPR